MSTQQEGRLKAGEASLKRKVDRLHPKVRIELSPADISYYQKLGDWALVLDRQSHAADLTNEEATGQANRVRNVLQMAAQMGLALPAPRENHHRKEGEFQFAFGEGVCKYHWFVDGLVGNASGFTASPYARLQLWRAAELAHLLGEHGCAPKAILIGELTRFFRDQKQFLGWYHKFKDTGAQVRFYGCPELTGDTEEMSLPMYLAQVGALSQWLKRQNAMARETRRQSGQLFKTRAPFGLRFNLDKSSSGYRREVFADPVEWPILQRLIHRISEGHLLTGNQVMTWFVDECRACGVDEARVPRSRGWLAELLKGDLLRGVYRQYAERCIPCRVVDGERESDWDHTPKGNRRYLVEVDHERAVSYPILMNPGDEIDPHRLALARITLTRRGQPRQHPRERETRTDRKAQSLLNDAMITCCACGYPVRESGPRQMKDLKIVRFDRETDAQLIELIYAGKTNAQIAAVMEVEKFRIEARRSWMKYRGHDRAEDLARFEAHWNDPFRRMQAAWHLYCLCVHQVAYQQAQDPKVVQTWPIAQHRRKRNGSISLALEPLLWDALQQDTRCSLTAPLAPPRHGNLAALEAEAERIAFRITKLQRDYEEDNWTFLTQDEARVRLAQLRAERATVEAQIAAVKGSTLTAAEPEGAQEWEDTRTKLREMLAHPQFQESWEHRRQLVELCVKRVEVDLETGLFEAETRFTTEPFQRLRGQVVL